jgi:hypothetical protein
MVCITGDNIAVLSMGHEVVNPKSLSAAAEVSCTYALCPVDVTVWVITNTRTVTLKSLRFALIVYLCASYDFRDKQRLIHNNIKRFDERFVLGRNSVFKYLFH